MQLTPEQLEKSKREYLKLLEKETKFRASFTGEVREKTVKVIGPIVGMALLGKISTPICSRVGSAFSSIITKISPLVLNTSPLIIRIEFPSTYWSASPQPSTNTKSVIMDSLKQLPSTLLTNSITTLLENNNLHPLQIYKTKSKGEAFLINLSFNLVLSGLVVEPWLERIRHGALGY